MYEKAEEKEEKLNELIKDNKELKKQLEDEQFFSQKQVELAEHELRHQRNITDNLRKDRKIFEDRVNEFEDNEKLKDQYYKKKEKELKTRETNLDHRINEMK